MIEVMAAMLILALVCVAYSKNQIGAIQLVKATRFRDTGIMLASQKMAETDFKVQDKGVEILKDDDKGEFDQEKFPTYAWHITKKQIPPPDFSSLMTLAAGSGSSDEEGGSDSGSQKPPSGSFDGPMKMITDAWGKSIFEVSLEINWKEGEKPKSYSLITHYISSTAVQQIQGIVGFMSGGGSAGATGATGASGTSTGTTGSSSSTGTGSTSGGTK